jgi:8-oxo-dGTP diphosphatase
VTIYATVGILKRADTILVAQRPPNKPYSGYWEFPGGKIEANETSEAAIKRELHEELGIQVTAAQCCFQHTHTYPDQAVVLEVWLITEFTGEPHSKENQQLRWLTWAEIMKLQLLEGNWAIMDRIKIITQSMAE